MWELVGKRVRYEWPNGPKGASHHWCLTRMARALSKIRGGFHQPQQVAQEHGGWKPPQRQSNAVQLNGRRCDDPGSMFAIMAFSSYATRTCNRERF